jgi:glycosyltransferase involved in cell wall biosynthesis
MTALPQEHHRRRVLVIAYYFPPLGLSGVQRTLKFVKYLPSYGWDVTVLTVEDRGYFAHDASLLEELEGLPVTVVRTRSLDPLYFLRKRKRVAMPSRRSHRILGFFGQFFFVPDNKIGWKKHAVRAARRLLAEQHHDLVFATAPPFTDFLIARDIKKKTGLPLVFDYRDPWLENPLHSYATPLHRFLHHRLELEALRYANHIVTINRRMKELTLRTAQSLSHHDVTILSQGFDPADFASPAPPRKDARMRITHTGTFYIDRTPKYFLHGLKRFFEQQPSARGSILATFVGTTREEDQRVIDELGLADSVEVTGYLPHRDCVQITRSSDVLWMMIGTSDGMDVASTGKLYEYIGARKPILACVPEGAARQTLRASQAALLCEPHDVEAIATAIATLYAQFRKGALPAPPDAFVQQFDRTVLTGELVKIFENILHVDEFRQDGVIE